MNHSEVRCICCKKPLSDPNYVLLQMGPECVKRYKQTPKRFDQNAVSLVNNDKGATRVILTDTTLRLAQEGQLVEAFNSNDPKVEIFYLNDKKSKVSQIGADVRGAARHGALTWQTIEEAEDLGIADQVIHRASLLERKDETQFIMDLSKTDFEKALVMTSLLKGFPEKPELCIKLQYSQFSLDKAEDAIESGECPYAIGYTDEYLATSRYHAGSISINHRKRKWSELRDVERGFTKDEYLKIVRSFYMKNYEAILDDMKKVMEDEGFANMSASDLKKKLEALARTRIREANRQPHCFLNKPFTKWFNTQFGNSSKSCLGVLEEYRSFDKPGSEDELQMMINGKSLRASFSKKIAKKSKPRKKTTKLSDFYTQEAQRIGPNIKEKTLGELQKVITEEIGLRGFQFGKSLPDAERLDHLRSTVESVDDLCFAIGIKRNQFSLNKELALAVGARGKSTALAHYEPRDKIINITRKNGVGSLCHEYFHALDHAAGESLGGDRYLTKRAGISNGVPLAEKSDRFFEAATPFIARMKQSDDFRSLPSDKRDYWASRVEVFARISEKMIDYKLRKKDRLNTYLTGGHHASFYPNEEELKSMESLFDDLVSQMFKSIKK